MTDGLWVYKELPMLLPADTTFSLKLTFGAKAKKMSWDFDIGDIDANYTSNVAPMFYAAFADSEKLAAELGENKGIRGLSGLTGSDAQPLLDAAIEYFHEHKVELEAMNPANGWGSYDGALKLLGKLSRGCEQWPDDTLRVF